MYLGKILNKNIYLNKSDIFNFGKLSNYWTFWDLKNITSFNSVINCNENKQVNLYFGIKHHFKDTFIIKDDKDLWNFCELLETYRILQKVYYLFKTGCAGISIDNPCRELLKAHSCNPQLIEEIVKSLHDILNKYGSN